MVFSQKNITSDVFKLKEKMDDGDSVHEMTVAKIKKLS